MASDTKRVGKLLRGLVKFPWERPGNRLFGNPYQNRMHRMLQNKPLTIADLVFEKQLFSEHQPGLETGKLAGAVSRKPPNCDQAFPVGSSSR